MFSVFTGTQKSTRLNGSLCPWEEPSIENSNSARRLKRNVYCTYYRETNQITCGTVTCTTHVPPQSGVDNEILDAKLPRGWYRIGQLQIRHDTGWFNLYRRRATGSGYWDFYTNIPERNCVGGFGLHAGENISGSITVTEKRCFDRLVTQMERKSTSEKFDVVQCRKCIFNSCWLGTRNLPDQRIYLTNLRSF
ncbi:hypothetical protein M3Y94_00288900 [Aphelenchoides besseyi]|nr:hypothetical protein M3Y94_00288900 [Aphelenchoides besseyi]